MQKEILVLHTTGEWWESRYHYKQIPALIEDGFRITHLFSKQQRIEQLNYDIIEVRQKFIRMTGGLNLLLKVLNSRIKVVQICNVELLPLGIVLSLFFRKIIFYDCIEDHFNSILHSKTSIPKLARYFLAYYIKILEFLASKTFSGIILSDPYLYKSSTAKAAQKMIFYNMPPNNLISQFKSNDEKSIDLVVLGSMSVRTGVLDVINAIDLLKDKNIKLKLIGDPFIDKDLQKILNQKLANKELKEKIVITGKVPFTEAINELKNCKIGVIPLLDLPKFRNNIAMKQWEYMAFQMPVISSKLLPQTYFIKEGINGMFYEAGNVDDLVKAVLKLIDDPGLISQMGSNGRDLVVKEWNAQTQQSKYIEFINLRMLDKPYVETQIPPFDF